MDCKQAKNLIPYAADGELDERLSNSFQAHIASCKACADALAAQKSLINGLELVLHDVSLEVSVAGGFTSSVVAKAREYEDSCGAVDRLGDCVAAALAVLCGSKRLVTTVSCAVVLASTLLLGSAALRMLDTTPVASAKVNPGSLITFTVRPAPDGKVVAGVDMRSYCRVTRVTEEALR